MFYAQYLWSRKGPLGTVWIAAHLQKKLRKKQITETDIGESVDNIIYSEVPIALRISSHLLLGVVRIYSRKVDYLFHDCSEALGQIRRAFYRSAINLPPDALVAPYHAITLPATFDFEELDDAYVNPENVTRPGTWDEFEHHVTARDLITLQEPMEDRGCSQSLFTLDVKFSDGGNPYTLSSMSNEEVNQKSDISKPVPVPPSSEETIQEMLEEDILPPLPIEEDMELHDITNGEGRVANDGVVNMDADVVSSTGPPNQEWEPQVKAVEEVVQSQELHTEVTAQDQDGKVIKAINMRVETIVEQAQARMDVDKEQKQAEDRIEGETEQKHAEDRIEGETGQKHAEDRHKGEIEYKNLEDQRAMMDTSPSKMPAKTIGPVSKDNDKLGSILGQEIPKDEVPPTSVIKSRGRKRKPIFDDVMTISSFEMKKQLGSTNDICRFRRKAPSTEYEIWISQRDNHIEQKFSGPALPGMSLELKRFFNTTMNTKVKRLQKRVRVDEGQRQVSSDIEEEHDNLNREAGATSNLEEPQEGFKPAIEIEAITSIKRSIEFESHQTAYKDNILREKENADTNILPDSEIHADVRVSAQDAEIQENGQVLKKTQVESDVSMKITAAPQPEGPLAVAVQPEGPLAAAPQAEGPPTTAPQPEGPPAEVPPAVAPQPEGPPAFAQDMSGVPPSHGLAFLADSLETGIQNGALSEIDTDSEHMGKLLEDMSRWASRTIAVAEYLKDKFEKLESIPDQAATLSLDKLLTGRTRREAARMFFEILVLRMKKYLGVHQQEPYSDIYLSPTDRLMKGEF